MTNGLVHELNGRHQNDFSSGGRPVRGSYLSALTLLFAIVPSAFAGPDPDLIFQDDFEGPPNPGVISGTVYDDSNYDGNLSAEAPRSGVQVYLDLNFNGMLDTADLTTQSATDGTYRFTNLPQGLYHVKQDLNPPTVQTFPGGGITPVSDGLPDEVVEYVHAAAGIGDFNVPYGKLAWPFPPEWGVVTTRVLPEPIDSVDLVLQPIGVRNKLTSGRVSRGVEVLTMPDTARLTVRFDEVIVDGPGPDLVIHTLDAREDEAFEVLVGPTAKDQVSMGTQTEDTAGVFLDLADIGYQGPAQFVTLIAIGNGGAWSGPEIAGFEALNVAAPEPGTHVVNITETEFVFEDRDFGVYAQDLPPNLALGVTDNEPATPELRAGESVTVQLTAADDVAIAGTTLHINGEDVPLDNALSAVVATPSAGEMLIEAEAVDSAGQSTTREAILFVLNADGSDPFAPNLTGSSSGGAGAPTVRIVTPAPGTVSSDDLPITASIQGPPEPTSWRLEIAPVADIDPYALEVDDPDYDEVASGSGSIYSDIIGIAPLATLADGIYFLRLTAQGSTGPAAYFGQVIAKNVAEADLRPQVTITAPTDGERVTVTADITGTITSTQPLLNWSVDYAPASEVNLVDLGADSASWQRIGEGTAPVSVESVLANFDATLLRSDSYVVRVIARNTIGLGWVEPLLLEAIGDVKLGSNRLVFTDLEIDLAGFPIRVDRVYDPLESDKSGEFGFGWSLALQDTKLLENVPDTGVAGLFGSTPFRVGTRVYLTAPTGERLAFTFQPELAPPTALGQPYRVVFEPDPGNYHRLEIPEGDAPIITIRPDGEAFLFPIGFPYNPERYVLITRDGKRYTIHEDRGLLAAEDLNGNTLSFNPEGIEHSSGVALRFARDAENRITEITDPEGNTWSYLYDGNGDLAAFTDADENTSVYAYLNTPAHFLESVTDPAGRPQRRYEYDPDTGRLIAAIDENGNRREFDWDPAAFDAMSTDARGNTTYVQYDERGNRTLVEDALGNTTTYEYSDPNNPDLETRITDALGETWDYQYNDQGLPTRLTTPLTSGLGQQRYDAEYDSLGNLTRLENANNQVSQYSYDEFGNRLSESPFDGIEFQFEYGPEGYLVRRRINDDFQVDYDYDARGFLSRQTDSYGYELNLVNTASGRLVERSDADGDLMVSYSPAGLLNTQTDANGNTVTLIRDADGSLTRTDRNGEVSHLTYDADDRPLTLEPPGGSSVITAYDVDGNPSTVTDPVGNIRTFGFDAINRLESITDAVGNTVTMSYDAVGNVIERIDRNGKRRTFEWDANRRMTRERWHDSGGAVVREMVFTYAAATGLEQVDDTDLLAGETYTLSYRDALPRPSRVTYSLPGQETWEVRYVWNNEIKTPADVRVNLGVSTRTRINVLSYGGQTWGLRWSHPGSPGLDNRVELYRNANGMVDRVQRETGVGDGNALATTRFEYDNLKRIAKIRHEDGSEALLHPNGELDYTWDAEDRVETETTAANTVSFDYDANSQIVSAAHSDPAYTDETYTYDVGGNRLTSHLAPSTATIGPANQVTASGQFSYEYDNAGNLTRRTDTGSGAVVEFAYDHRNRLTQASTHPSLGAPADDVLEYGYDYKDRLLFRVLNGSRTWLLHDRHQPIAEFAEGASVLNAAFFYNPAGVDKVYAAWRDDALGERWFLHDQLGSVRAVTNGAFVVQAWLDYDSYGNLQPGSALPAGENLAFASRPWIGELALYDNRRRFYDPGLGRFSQEDPTGLRGLDHHLYRYALNSPTFFTDPTGEASAGIHTALVLEAILLNIGSVSDQLKTPCDIASSVDAYFSYFVPLAEVISDPPNAPPTLTPESLLEATGCSPR